MNQALAIEVQNVTVIYNEGTPNEVVSLDNVSLNVAKGQIVIVTGGNGSGKSTLLKAIAGTTPIKSGKILLHGKDVTNWPAHRKAKEIGFVHQDPILGTCPNLTVHENFQLSTSKPWWMPIPYRLSLSEEQLEFIGKTGLPLIEKAATPVSMLSGGQRQAIALCLAFGPNYSILLLDEFTSALDEKTEEKVLSFALTELRRFNATALIIMHDLNKAKELRFPRFKMNYGKLINDSF
ncbi:MAG: ATP-binding cassette domain-containing protein [Candidatus Brocadiales bacterium]|nr:ATP-binding cassette domain-containing protein [Candidatus Brocadiales bacterium]